jgi:phage-related protein
VYKRQFITLHKKFKRQSVRRVPWYRKEYTGQVPIPALGPDIFSTDPQQMRQVREINMQRMMSSRSQAQPSISSVVYGGDDEQVVIRNPGLAQELTGWQLTSSQGGQSFQFPAGFVLMSDGEIRVHSGPKAASTTPGDLVWTSQPMWNDQGDTATLLDAQGNVVSSFSYEARKP